MTVTTTSPETIPLTASAAVPDHVLTQEIEGQTAILHLTSDCYFGLDDVGTAIWQAVTSQPTIGAAIEHLESLYDVEHDRLSADVMELLGRLVENDLLELT